MPKHVAVIAAAERYQPRVEFLAGAEHLVVPVVALIEGIITPLGSNGPEYVPADALALAPDSWNGRPLVSPHPMDGENLPGSANTVDRLEWSVFGLVLNATYDAVGRRLLVEAWIDVAKATELGGDALRVLERARDGEPIEVSVGCSVISEVRAGVFKGRAYESIWRVALSDHLAMLPEGQTGACSIAMGCGVRAAMQGVSMSTKACCSSDDAAAQCVDCRAAAAAADVQDGWGLALEARALRGQAAAETDLLDPWAAGLARRQQEARRWIQRH